MMMRAKNQNKLLVFGGVYSNLQALEALLNFADAEGFSAENMLCTGDVVAYCADPEPCVQLIREREIPCVMGNCEESLASGALDCGCGFEEGSLCNVLSGEWYAYASGLVSADSKLWMAGLPRQLPIEFAELNLTAVHGDLHEINAFVFPEAGDAFLEGKIASTGGQGILAGHSGIPFVRRLPSGFWLNTGALGMPAHDGTPQTWFAVLTVQDGKLDITLKSLTYDHEKARKSMLDAGLGTAYADALVSGIWPSEDVLPDARKGGPQAVHI